MACHDNGNQLVLDANQENLSESAQCSPKTASLFNCQVAGSESPTSLSGEKNNLLSPRSDISEISNMDIVVNKCELPYAYEDDSNSETSSNPTISPLTVISLDLDNDDTSLRNIDPVIGPELSPLFVDTSLANFTFERFVTGNNLLNYCSQAPGYVVFRNMPSNIPPRTPRPRTPNNLGATLSRRRRPALEYLNYYSRMNTPMCITFDSLPESAWEYYNGPHTHPQNSQHELQSSEIHIPETTGGDGVDSLRNWQSSPSVNVSDDLPDISERYSLHDIVHYATYPMCARVKYASCPTDSTLREGEAFIPGSGSNPMPFEWPQDKSNRRASFDCKKSEKEGCFECSTMQLPCQMDTNLTYQDPSMPENGPNHIYWESQLPQSTHTPSLQSVNVQFVSDPNPYQLQTDTPYFGNVPYYTAQPIICPCGRYTYAVQPMACQCEECTQIQGVNPYPYYYS